MLHLRSRRRRRGRHHLCRGRAGSGDRRRSGVPGVRRRARMGLLRSLAPLARRAGPLSPHLEHFHPDGHGLRGYGHYAEVRRDVAMHREETLRHDDGSAPGAGAPGRYRRDDASVHRRRFPSWCRDAGRASARDEPRCHQACIRARSIPACTLASPARACIPDRSAEDRTRRWSAASCIRVRQQEDSIRMRPRCMRRLP